MFDCQRLRNRSETEAKRRPSSFSGHQIPQICTLACEKFETKSLTQCFLISPLSAHFARTKWARSLPHKSGPAASRVWKIRDIELQLARCKAGNKVSFVLKMQAANSACNSRLFSSLINYCDQQNFARSWNCSRTIASKGTIWKIYSRGKAKQILHFL